MIFSHVVDRWTTACVFATIPGGTLTKPIQEKKTDLSGDIAYHAGQTI